VSGSLHQHRCMSGGIGVLMIRTAAGCHHLLLVASWARPCRHRGIREPAALALVRNTSISVLLFLQQRQSACISTDLRRYRSLDRVLYNAVLQLVIFPTSESYHSGTLGREWESPTASACDLGICSPKRLVKRARLSS